MVVFWKADIFSITAIGKLYIAGTNQFVIINVHAFNIRILFTSTNNLKLFIVTDKPVTETNRGVGREEAVTDVDRLSEGGVECTGRQAEVPLLGSDDSMYIIYQIWSIICILYFLLDIFTAVFSLFPSPPPPHLFLYPFLMLGTQYSVYILYSVLCLLSGWFFTQLYSSQSQQFFSTTKQFLTAVMLSQTLGTINDYLRPQTIPFADLRVSARENIQIYTVSLLWCPRTRKLSRDISAEADVLCDKTIVLTDTIKQSL